MSLRLPFWWSSCICYGLTTTCMSLQIFYLFNRAYYSSA
ncbi:hypothetical protein F383_17186 [Gossypium arboreum]|uniref:Uncharacterized protein n=1 Tax=Gossypium arboreum TaxID=29729 RepID=A0A0B0NJF7_GOSAR|nr:hypothetical protein F383_17186 [Gossypium arboreum]